MRFGVYSGTRFRSPCEVRRSGRRVKRAGRVDVPAPFQPFFGALPEGVLSLGPVEFVPIPAEGRPEHGLPRRPLAAVANPRDATVVEREARRVLRLDDQVARASRTDCSAPRLARATSVTGEL